MKTLLACWLLLGAATLQANTRIPPQPSPEATADRIAKIIVPGVEFRDTTLGEAVEYLRQASQQGGSPVNIVLRDSPVMTATGTRLTLSLRNVPLSEILGYVARQADLQISMEAYAVVLTPASQADQTLHSAVFNVPPTFFGNRPAAAP